MSKSLDEFISDRIEHFGDDLGSDAIYTQKIINDTIKEALRVAEEWCEYEIDYGFNGKMNTRGENETADELRRFLKQWAGGK